MSGWLEALLGSIFNSGVSIPLSKGLNFASGLAASLNPTTKQIDVILSPVANASLAPMAAGTAKGRRIDDIAGTPVDLTGAEQGENIRYEFVQSVALAPGVYDNYEVDWRASALVIGPSAPGDVILNGIQLVSSPGVPVSNVGGLLRIQKEGGIGRLLLRHAQGTSITTNQFWTPLFVDYVLPSGFDGVLSLHQGARWRLCDRALASDTSVRPVALALVDANGEGVSFRKRVAFSATGATGTLIDVDVWNAAAPFALRITRAELRVSTAAGTASALRTASAGGGSVVLPDAGTPTQTFSTATTGLKPDNAVASATVAANGSLFFRVDRAVAGEIVLDCVRI